MANTQQGLPGVPGVAMVGPDGIPTQGWYSFFLNLWQRTGGASGGASAILDQVTTVVGSMLYRATNGWAGLTPGAQYRVLRMGVQLPEWDVLDGNSFGSQLANKFLVSPNGSAGNPTFRAIATADLDSTAGQYPGTSTNDNASVGNIGEYVSSTVAAGSAVSLSNVTEANVTSISLTAGDWDVWCTVAFNQTGNTSWVAGGPSLVSATTQAIETGATTTFSYTAAGTPIQQITTPVPPVRFSLSSTTTVYMVAIAAFSSGASGAYGTIQARRAR